MKVLIDFNCTVSLEGAYESSSVLVAIATCALRAGQVRVVKIISRWLVDPSYINKIKL